MRAMSGTARRLELLVDNETRSLVERLIGYVDGAMGAEEDASDHPIAKTIKRWSDWDFRRLAEVATDVSVAAAWKGFDRARRRLADPDGYEDILFEIRVAAEFSRASIAGHFVPEGKRKAPDLNVQIDGDAVPIEVTHIGPPPAMEKLFTLADPELWEAPEFKGLTVNLRLQRYLSKPHIEELKRELVQVAKRVRRSGGPERYELPNTLEAHLSKRDDPTSSRMKIEGLSFPREEVGRLIQKIEEKAPKIPSGQPGVLVIFDSELMQVSERRSPDYASLARGVEEYLFDQADLSALLIIVPFVDASGLTDQVFHGSVGQWAAWRKLGPRDSLIEDRILILNRFSHSPLNPVILRALGYPP